MSAHASVNQDFESKGSAHARRRLSNITSGDKPVIHSSLTVSHHDLVGNVILIYVLQPMWAGVAGVVPLSGKSIEVAISVHDSVYSTDFTSAVVPYNAENSTKNAAEIENYVVETLKKFSKEHLCKFLGAGVTLSLLKEVLVVSSVDLYIACSSL